MNKKKLTYAISAVILVLLFFIINNTFNQSGIKEMSAGFTEVAQYRNENNTGPVQRIYVVTVKDSLWKEMESYGNLMPHTKYGNTKVYFFMDNTDVPKTLEPGKVNFSAEYDKNCIALFEKSAMSLVLFNRYPFNYHGEER